MIQDSQVRESRTVTAEFADHQRSGFHHPLHQPSSHSRTTDIAKVTERTFLTAQQSPTQIHTDSSESEPGRRRKSIV